MDSDLSSSASSAGKIRNCQCGTRTSSIKHDFHSVCPPDAEALSWLGGLGAGSWALMLGGGVFLPDLGAQLLVYPN